jgi:tRNA (guanosine-2'-O-)-methyltransferase
VADDSSNILLDPRSSHELFSKRQLVLSPEINLGGKLVTVDAILDRLRPVLTSERIGKLDQVVSQRSFQLVSVLENIYDRGNVSAVMRSADAFGFLSLHLVDPPGAKFKAANRVSKGSEKWLDVNLHSSPKAAVETLRGRGYKIYATHLDTATTVEDLDFSGPTAIVLGNEKEGVSPEMLALVDGTFRIPMYGFSQSFNISVAAALILYQARLNKPPTVVPGSPLSKQILANYYLRCFDSPEIYF